MAEKAPKKDEAAGEAAEGGAKSSKLKKIILIVVAALLLVGISVGLTLFLTGALNKDKEAEAEPAAEEVEQHVPAEYLPLQPAFVVNYTVKGRQRYLQVGVSLMYREADVSEAVKKHMPVIRNRLVMLFGGESFEQLQTPEGKDALRQKALAALQEILEKEIGKPGIEEVLFTDFVMQ